MRRSALLDRLLLSGVLLLASATAACTGDTRPTASDFELRTPNGGGAAQSDEDDADESDAPAEGEGRARLSATPSPLLVLLGSTDTVPATRR